MSTPTPRASKQSAVPQAELAARLPCLTTLAPAPAATRAAIVEMLTVLARSPPVPTMSTASRSNSTGMAWEIIPSAMPAISSAVSPLARSATAKPATCTGVSSPDRTLSIAAAAVPRSMSRLATRSVSRSAQVNSSMRSSDMKLLRVRWSVRQASQSRHGKHEPLTPPSGAGPPDRQDGWRRRQHGTRTPTTHRRCEPPGGRPGGNPQPHP